MSQSRWQIRHVPVCKSSSCIMRVCTRHRMRRRHPRITRVRNDVRMSSPERSGDPMTVDSSNANASGEHGKDR